MEAVREGHMRQSVYRHQSGCALVIVLAILRGIRALLWVNGHSPNGSSHLISIRVSVQDADFMDFTQFVRGGDMPVIPII
ncbi:uncharacterized protein VTP21DRAFT_1498 [Calcarisporiella thermophila]|uniref:uncharacterized protein n=1 Tax=Calcarisporiella thermophila TaxID=911321 RepID=UPI003743573A